MGVPLLSPRIADALQRGASILTANQRAARTLRRAFDLARHEAGEEVWSTAEVLPLESWCDARWRSLLLEGHTDRVLLNRSQEHSLWRSIVVSDREMPSLRSPDALADLAAKGWRLLRHFGVRHSAREFTASTDTRAFARWATEFERRCTRSRLLSAAELPEALTAACSEGTLEVPSSGVMLVDFDELPPAYEELFEAVQRAGYPVERERTFVDMASAVLFEAEDARDEMRNAAEWVRLQVAQAPGSRVAIVVPGLDAKRAEIERVFGEILEPALRPITMSGRATSYEFSLGDPLTLTALGSSALSLLEWAAHPIPIESISVLLLSPFFGALAGASSDEAVAVADADVLVLRRAKLLRPELSLERAISLLQESPRARSVAGVLARMRRMHRVASEEQMVPASGQAEGPRQSYADWTESFRRLLDAAGWSQAAARDSLNFQAHRRWESTLDELATLDFAAVHPTAAAALRELRRIAEQTIFAPESQDAPVQIVGPLELGAVPFDALWFLGADDLAWPTLPASNPLLPFSLQRTSGMPGTNTADDHARARMLTERIAHSATSVVFSFAREAESGVRRASSMLSGLHLSAMQGVRDSVLQPIPFKDAALVFVADTSSLPRLPDRVVRGGANILQLQAACAFRAFAERRLGSREPEIREAGFDARERGNLVHNVMESFWARVQTRAGLRLLQSGERSELLERCIDVALSKLRTQPGSAWDAAYVEVQRRRLHTLLEPWLRLEAERPDFAVREEEKTLHDVRIGPLRLELRVDRIDDTAGGALIIDYKTGSAKTSEWLGERPDAPQLPLYAVLAEESELGGVAFASLRAGDGLALNGFADDTDVLRKSGRMEADSLAEQAAKWRDILERLADAFVNGDTRVLPKSYPQTCKHCAQRILCRLDPTALDAFYTDEDGSSAEPLDILWEDARG